MRERGGIDDPRAGQNDRQKGSKEEKHQEGEEHRKIEALSDAAI
ncbi:hypothetical protein [Bradyrhizobium sp. AUGA SZCCT0431]|nr:hypothetical protein [Bradyrhizobium sp. AUGA SZCCT0431]